MNLDDVTEAWRSKDLSQLYGVDKTLLHQMLRQERAKLEKQRRTMRWFMYAVNAMLLICAALFFAILIDPHQPPEFSARVVVWDYVVGIVGVAAGLMRRASGASVTRFGITCGVVSRTSTPK